VIDTNTFQHVMPSLNTRQSLGQVSEYVFYIEIQLQVQIR